MRDLGTLDAERSLVSRPRIHREAYSRAVDELIGAVIAGRRHRLDATQARAMVAVLDAARRDALRPKIVPAAPPPRGRPPYRPAAGTGRPISAGSLT
jgi:hypothetical protein